MEALMFVGNHRDPSPEYKEVMGTLRIGGFPDINELDT